MRRGSVVRVPCACALVCDRDLLLACVHEFPCTRVGRWQCVANVCFRESTCTFVFARLCVRVLCLISSCICSLSGSVFVGVSRDACVVLLMSVSGDECVYVCLWMFAHVVCGCGLVCVPRASWVYVPFGHPVYTCLFVCAHPCPRGSRAHVIVYT